MQNCRTQDWRLQVRDPLCCAVDHLDTRGTPILVCRAVDRVDIQGRPDCRPAHEGMPILHGHNAVAGFQGFPALTQASEGNLQGWCVCSDSQAHRE